MRRSRVRAEIIDVGGSAVATPATNEQIAREVHLGVDAVKKHLGVLFERFDATELPQTEKRVRLAERVLTGGIISRTEL